MGTQVLLNKLPGVPTVPCPHCWEEEVHRPGGTAEQAPLMGHKKGGVRAPLFRERCVNPVWCGATCSYP